VRLDPARILVVHADPGVLLAVRAALLEAGHAVDEAASPAEARELLQRCEPELAFVQSELGEPGEASLWCQLREECPELPLVLIAGSGGPPALAGAHAWSVLDELDLPLDDDVLRARVDGLVRTGRSIRALIRAQRMAQLGSWEWDLESDEMHWCDGMQRLLGRGSSSTTRSSADLFACVHPEDRTLVRERVLDAVEAGKEFVLEHRVADAAAAASTVRLQGLVREIRGARRAFGTVQDVSEEARSREALRDLAHRDSLTGLANRHQFVERLDAVLADARRRDHPVALLYLDLDQFKRVNDTLGHAAGDELLKSMAARLLHQVRHTDEVGRVHIPHTPPDGSRLGGDEFTVLISPLRGPEDAGEVAGRILEALRVSVSLGSYEVTVTGSIGIALFPEDGEDAETLMQHADRAMVAAKAERRDSFRFFSPAMNAASQRKLAIASRLPVALEQNALRLFYQPRVDPRTQQVAGLEALLRWEDPELGRVTPGELIPLAEETGLIVPLGRWVLQTACAQIRAWRDAGIVLVPISVNVSPMQFMGDDVREAVTDALRRNGVSPGVLEIEITESALLEHREDIALTLRDLRMIGVRVALDDFGTGYASVSYLTRVPLDVLKIDRVLLRDAHADPGASGIVEAVIAMGHGLGLRVVAEGVDHDDLRTLLIAKGCDEIQGFLVSAALPPDEIAMFVRRSGVVPARD
jgi:diguanylate cyclase (GGDEF)-like protein